MYWISFRFISPIMAWQVWPESGNRLRLSCYQFHIPNTFLKILHPLLHQQNHQMFFMLLQWCHWTFPLKLRKYQQMYTHLFINKSQPTDISFWISFYQKCTDIYFGGMWYSKNQIILKVTDINSSSISCAAFITQKTSSLLNSNNLNLII